MEDVELGLRDMGAKIWRTGALDRTEWASVLREIDAILDCSAKEEESHNFILFTWV